MSYNEYIPQPSANTESTHEYTSGKSMFYHKLVKSIYFLFYLFTPSLVALKSCFPLSDSPKRIPCGSGTFCLGFVGGQNSRVEMIMCYVLSPIYFDWFEQVFMEVADTIKFRSSLERTLHLTTTIKGCATDRLVHGAQ